MSILLALIRRDIRLSFSQGWAGLSAVFFYLAVGVMTPFALGPEPKLLAQIAGGMAWLAALLASLLTLERLFQSDAEDGTLDALATSTVSMEFLALIKILSHWITTALPLLLATPLLALFLQLPPAKWLALLLSLVLGTPALSAIGAAAAALAVGVKRGGLLITVLVLPLVVPPIIFGVASIGAGAGSATAFKILAAFSLAACALSPFATAAALRLALRG
jgi:heme exporter protein B